MFRITREYGRTFQTQIRDLASSIVQTSQSLLPFSQNINKSIYYYVYVSFSTPAKLPSPPVVQKKYK